MTEIVNENPEMPAAFVAHPSSSSKLRSHLPSGKKKFLPLLIILLIIPITIALVFIQQDTRSKASVIAPAGPLNFSDFGPQPVESTPLASGTKFASPTGTGTACTVANPCGLVTAVNSAVPGDVIFMRGGVYKITEFILLNKSANASSYITLESYPGEMAILDGSSAPLVKDYIRAYGNYYKLRKFEVRNMPQQGIFVQGNHNVLDGIITHNNKLSGIIVYAPSNVTDGTIGSYNTLQNITATDNSDVGLTGGDYNNGGNADGISVSGGVGNVTKNVLVARNSDDGYDSWRSTNSHISYSVATGNGLGGGNGIGFKLGGIAPSGGAIIDYSIAYKNRTAGFDPNGGENVTIDHVTAWDNQDYGIYAYPTTKVANSISIGNANNKNIVGQNGPTSGTQSNNSWQKSGTASFISTEPTSEDFLKPTLGGGFESIGAYAGSSVPSVSNSPIPTQGSSITKAPAISTPTVTKAPTPTPTRIPTAAPVSSNAYPNSVLSEPGLIGYWRVGEKTGTLAADDSTVRNNGAFVGNPTLGIVGALKNNSNTAVDFSASSGQFVQISSNAAYNFGKGNYTIEFWFKTTTNGLGFIVERGGTDCNGFEAYWDGSMFSSRVSGCGTSVNSASSSSFRNGAWHYAAVVMDRTGSGQWYIDGAKSGAAVDISGSANTVLTGTKPLYIAKRGVGNNFTGSLDEIAIYNKALTASQVLSHYNAGAK